MPKIIPDTKFTELKCLDRIAIAVHEMKFLWREITKSDFGIDGEIEVSIPKPDGKGRHVTGGVIKVQAKSGSSYIVEDQDNSFSLKSSKEDFELWHGADFPILLIAYHPAEDRLFWKEVRGYVKNTPSVWKHPFKVSFDKTQDTFDRFCADKLMAISDSSPPRVSYSEKEQLYSNLLKITQIPKMIWHAPTDLQSPAEVTGQTWAHTPPFIIKEKRIFTFISDLNALACTLRSFCDTDRIDDCPVENLWPDDQRDYATLLNQLLGKHLSRQGLFYSAMHRRNYFPRLNTEELEFKREWHNIRSGRMATRAICKFYQYGKDKFWRHIAANFRFRRFVDSWFLQIIPMYFFTSDGRSPYESERVGPLTTKIKAMETNLSVLNHVLFWSNVVSGIGSKSSTASIWLDDRTRVTKPALIIRTLPVSGISEFAIPYDPAVYEEPAGPMQTSLFASLTRQAKIDEDKDEAFPNSDDEWLP